MDIALKFPCTDDEMKAAKDAAAQGNPMPLRLLCQKEVRRFEEAIRTHPDYRDGLVMIERRAVEGYLYQKLRNHVDASPSSNQPAKE